MSDFINSTVNTKFYNTMQDEHQIITIVDKEVITKDIGTIASGDTNSCLLSFEINRFQDGIDLSDKKIRYNYRNSAGKFYDIAVNVKYNDEVIRFSWLLPYSFTQPGDNVIASIEFYGATEYDEQYSYKTKNFKLSVEKSLGVSDESDQSYNNWTIKIENDVETIHNRIGEIEKDIKSLHIPSKLSEMEDDSEHRTVSDSQINSWNSSHENVQADWNESNIDSNAYIKNKPHIPKVTNDLTDELKQAYDDAASKKHTHMNKSVLDEIAQDDIESWNNKSEFDGNYSSLQGIPQGLATESYVDEKVKDKVNESDLATVAKTGSYNDLKDSPVSLPASDVYEWAKQSQKPSYTADEIGALPNNTEIPSKTSDLQNDSGYLTEHQDLSDYALKEDLVDKLDKPTTTPAVGKILKVTAVNDDGSFVCEWSDAPSGDVTDVIVDGNTIVNEKGVAEIPRANTWVSGVVRSASEYSISNWRFDNTHKGSYFVQLGEIDNSVRYAMCDGKGKAWTSDEQAAARARMGVGDYELVVDVTTTEETQNINIETDTLGNPLNLKQAMVMVHTVGTNSNSGEGAMVITLFHNSNSKGLKSTRARAFRSDPGSIIRQYALIFEDFAIVADTSSNTNPNFLTSSAMLANDPFKTLCGVYLSGNTTGCNTFGIGSRVLIYGVRA